MNPETRPAEELPLNELDPRYEDLSDDPRYQHWHDSVALATVLLQEFETPSIEAEWVRVCRAFAHVGEPDRDDGELRDAFVSFLILWLAESPARPRKRGGLVWREEAEDVLADLTADAELDDDAPTPREVAAVALRRATRAWRERTFEAPRRENFVIRVARRTSHGVRGRSPRRRTRSGVTRDGPGPSPDDPAPRSVARPERASRRGVPS